MNQVNTALAIKPSQPAKKPAAKPVKKPVYDHTQGDCNTHNNQLPAIIISEKKRYQPTVLIGQQTQASVLEQAKPAIVESKPKASKVNAFGTSKGYGDRWPNDGTSAAAIWAALAAQNDNVTHVTKVWAEKLSAQNLQCNKGRVNDANLAIEINSFRKYLNHHGLMSAPKTEVA
jgi:hypothetical protein